VIANQFAIVNQQLGAAAGDVEFVAIDNNPVFHNVADVAAFTKSHGLSDLSNWHFLAGPVKTLQDVLAAYGEAVDVPAVGMIQHSSGVYFMDSAGREVGYLNDQADTSLTTPYVDVLRQAISKTQVDA
jgi:cytochrome oxidase Cu insertion factor (SCO1/SenC/PrrC family)